MTPLPPLQRDQKRLRWAVMVLILGSLGAFAFLPLPKPAVSLLPACGFHTLTGLPCALCGGTRSAKATLRGDLSRAVYLNPLAIPVVAGLLLTSLVAGLEIVRSHPLADWTVLRQRWSWHVPAALIVLLLLWWPFHLGMALRTPKSELVDLRNPIARAAQARLGQGASPATGD